MAYRILSCCPDNDTDAHFRLWINEIHNALIAFGWLQTTDTGQINFSTVTRPTGNVYPGFACYKMNDSLQATCAVFIRIDFGSGPSITDVPSIKFRIAIGGTDGSGGLTGNVSATYTMGGTQGPTTTFSNVRTSGSSSSFRAMFWPTTLPGFVLNIERDRDSSGNETTNGVHFVFIYGTNNSGAFAANNQYLGLSGTNGVAETTRVYALLSSNSSQTWGAFTGVAPVCSFLGPCRNPMMGLLITALPDFALETTSPVPIYGATHTYMMGRVNNGGASNLNIINANCGVAILWE